MRTFFIILLCCAFSGAAHANTSGFLGLSVGFYNVLDSKPHALSVDIEYRPDTSIFTKQVKPWLGLKLTDNISGWFGGGLLYEATFGKDDKWFAAPSFGAGLYRHGSDDIDLGHLIEFRSRLELGYSLDNNARIGASFEHLSNAGLGNSNPGTEVFSLFYHIPLSLF